MKFLVEDYGQSEQLDEFVRLANRKFSTYYDVIITDRDNREQHNYFAFDDAAKNYYNTMVKAMIEDIDYYENYQISLTQIDVRLNPDELEFKIIDIE